MTASSRVPIHLTRGAEARRGEIGVPAPQNLTSGEDRPDRNVARISDHRNYDGTVTPHRRPVLSSREVEVLLGWLAAESKEDAATTLFISASTVSTHLARIRAKYSAVGRDAPTKTHLLARALQDGYTSLDRW
ncbi:LuxR C-terminal-related transcriptional regulator [Gordonia sp. SL306]|uniref:LuxR C-terminal-related transcriptional regulator n=1 Tax=Gordonia sp. SL306 TaxID=2995145 RepID=UPI003B63F289